jgi:hypothetical protein
VEQKLHQRKEIVRLVDIGVLEEDYSSEWASLIFETPKKIGTIRIVNNFRNLSLLMKHSVLPIYYSKIGDMFRPMEWFTSNTASELNMSYHHIKLDADSQ